MGTTKTKYKYWHEEKQKMFYIHMNSKNRFAIANAMSSVYSKIYGEFIYINPNKVKEAK